MNRTALDDSFLISAAADRRGDDPIFALNAEAKRRQAAGEKVVNATLGALMEDDGRLAVMPTVFETLRRIDPQRAAAYAPIAGDPRFLSHVVSDLFGASPIATHAVGVATPGGSGALSLAIVSFLEPGQALLTPSFYWGPYATMAHHSGRRVETFSTFDAAGRFDVAAFESALFGQLASQGRALVLLNSPCNNPTGYSFDDAEWCAVTDVAQRASKLGRVAILIDLAYAKFAAPATPDFSRYADQLADGPLLLAAWTASKTFTYYGGRVGALVAVHPDAAERARIQSAFAFGCRGTWSNCNHQGMLAISEILGDATLRAQCDRERERLRSLLSTRVAAFNAAAKKRGLRFPRYEGGFFVTVFHDDVENAARAMKEQGVFVVPSGKALRVALCSTPVADVARLVDSIPT